VEEVSSSYQHRLSNAHLRCVDASAVRSSELPEIDLCFFDPPYYDYIAYSELSELSRAWLNLDNLNGSPLLPDTSRTPSSFAERLHKCLKPVVERLKAGRPLAFTFRSTSPEAWFAVGAAIDALELAVTATWPVRSDPHMGHHASDGNCEWDLVVVCRKVSEVHRRYYSNSVEDWKKAVAPIRVGQSDCISFRLCIQMIKERFATVAS